MYIHIYKCRQITIRDHNSGISGENANEPSNSFKRLRRSKHSSEILPSNALLLCAPPVFNIYSTLIFSQHVIFLWSTNINSSGYYIVIDITYQFLSNIDVTLMLSMSVFSKILYKKICSAKMNPVFVRLCVRRLFMGVSVHMYVSFKLK